MDAKWIIYKIDGSIVTETVGPKASTFDDFLSNIPENDCRYAIYDMNFTTNDGRPGNKLVMISWYVSLYSSVVLQMCG